MWLHVEAFMSFRSLWSVHIGFLCGFMWRLQKEYPISNGKMCGNLCYILTLFKWLFRFHKIIKMERELNY
jgi:hypothetical protein